MNLVEFAANGGQAHVFGRPLMELSRRQLRFLFATGAFKAGKAAAVAVRASAKAYGGESSSVRDAQQKRAALAAIRVTATRAAAKQAMQQQLRAYKGAKAAGHIMAKAIATSAGQGKVGTALILRSSRQVVRGSLRRAT